MGKKPNKFKTPEFLAKTAAAQSIVPAAPSYQPVTDPTPSRDVAGGASAGPSTQANGSAQAVDGQGSRKRRKVSGGGKVELNGAAEPDTTKLPVAAPPGSGVGNQQGTSQPAPSKKKKKGGGVATDVAAVIEVAPFEVTTVVAPPAKGKSALRVLSSLCKRINSFS